ncbi:MAG: dihydroflavonol 4-reductase [Legionellales bacterium]|nr:dihydroflavonol 4-reductase [Legionellales bacterium]
MDHLKKICVVGASGLVGSSIVRCALEKGYNVNGTLRDVNITDKTKYLYNLVNGNKLKLYSAHMENELDFLDPLEGVDAVFIACLIPVYKGFDGTLAKELDYERGYKEIITPTVEGCLNILRVANKQGVKNAIICSSTSSTNPIPPVKSKNEVDHWSNEDFQCKERKFTSATKTVIEKAAFEFCGKNNIRLSIILPTGLYGDAIMPEHMKHNPFSWLKNAIEGGYPRHEKIPNDSSSMIHLRDLANIFLAVYENKECNGRYFGVYDSIHWQDIYAECKKLIPQMKLPEPIKEKAVKPTGFDFSRRDSIGLEIKDFRITLKDTINWIKSDPFLNK